MTDSNENHRILVIDDMESIHQDFRKILLKDKHDRYRFLDDVNSFLEKGDSKHPEKKSLPLFEIDSAYKGDDAVQLVKKSLENQTPYAVAFVDVQMPPGIDGVETISRLWELDPNIQVVICTAYAKYSPEDIFERFGETDRLFVLKKPFDGIEVIQLACSLTKRWKSSQSMLLNHAELQEKNKETLSSLRETIDSLANINEKLKKQQSKDKKE